MNYCFQSGKIFELGRTVEIKFLKTISNDMEKQFFNKRIKILHIF